MTNKYFGALYETNIDCSLVEKLCKITPPLTGNCGPNIFP